MKNRNVFVIIVLFLILVFVFGLLYIMGFISFNKNDEGFWDKANYDPIYNSVISEYRSAINDDVSSITMGEYEYVNLNVMLDYFDSNKSDPILYTYYDINNDNVKELIISKDIVEIFTYDGYKVKRLFEDQSTCLGGRCSLEVYDNGIIHFKGSDGAKVESDSFYKIEDKTGTLNNLSDYTVLYDGEDNIRVYNTSDYINNDSNATKLNFKSVDEIINYNVGDAKKIDVDSLAWYTIVE